MSDAHKHLLCSRYIIRSDPLAHVPDELPVCQAGTRLKQEYGTETRGETHLWNQSSAWRMHEECLLSMIHTATTHEARCPQKATGKGGVTTPSLKTSPAFTFSLSEVGICVHFAVKWLLYFSQFRLITRQGDGMLWTKHTVQALFSYGQCMKYRRMQYLAEWGEEKQIMTAI